MPLSSVSFQSARVTSPFWAKFQRCVRESTVPSIIKAQKTEGHWDCLTWKKGHRPQPHAFWDSDIYKTTEAACNFLLMHPNEDMLRVVEETVDMIRNAQHPDGYINSFYTVRGLENRWTNLRDLHELYCLGHLYEATVAYETLTKSGRLLEVATKSMHHIDSIFGREEGKKRGYPGHQEIELGLLRLYDMTGDPLALRLAKYFILERGTQDDNGETYFDHEAFARGADPYDGLGSEVKGWFHGPRDYAYNQADRPIREQAEIKGHAVRAMYYYTAVTDLIRVEAASDPDVAECKQALQRLWRNMVDCKMYVTGAIGSYRQNEGFGEAFVLNDLEMEGCYGETCAAFALIMWCHRMLQMELNSEYADVMENCLYNGFLGAISSDGEAFYYQNVLRTKTGQSKDRERWFGVACCPPNVAKLVGSLGSLLYSTDDAEDLIAVHMYVQSEVELTLGGKGVKLSVITEMPWSGEVTIRVEGAARLALRIPDWVQDQGYTCSMEGELNQGYLHITDVLEGTEVRLSLPTPAHRLYAHPKTGKDAVCIRRGPFVYCLEDVDNEAVDIDHIALEDERAPQEGSPVSIATTHDVVPLQVTGRKLARVGVVTGERSRLYGPKAWEYDVESLQLIAIPYFLRANRGGNGAMRVWTPRLKVK
ncbi:hypothetical protein CLIM01_06647 [Colletotrichum limetticola]|uniref:DUF1680 domain-containing protein n=1 Tax=Colletotrichum limetticola TaxID=1209924 RepID=A0ABQ9PWQ6_9PEZI|nr:hypothetical protein CLIM01_06647 [Colletotrichum limetticola]